MRTLLMIVSSVLVLTVSGQGYGSFDPLFFLRDASARAEALGGGDMAMTGDLRSVFSNPASILSLQGLEFYGHTATPYYIANAARYHNAAIGYRISDRLAFGAAYNRFEYGWENSGLQFGDDLGEPIDGSELEVLHATVGYKVLGGLSVGVTGSWLKDEYANGPDLLWWSPGLAHTMQPSRKGVLRHGLSAGISLHNANQAERNITYEYRRFVFNMNDPVPTMGRAAVAYTLGLHKGWLVDTLRSAAFTVHVQLDDEINEPTNTALRIGAELWLLDLLALRCGWFQESVYDYGYPEYNKNELNEFTYGFGVNIPVGLFTKGKVPLTIGVDYTEMPQWSYSVGDLSPFTDEPWSNFQSLGIRVNCGLGTVFKRRPATT